MRKGATLNRMKTVVLLATLTAVLVWAGDTLGGQTGLVTALVLAGVMNFGAYWWSDRLILRMFGAQEVTEREAPALHQLVRDLALRGGIPVPRVYVIPEAAPNAFATGRNPQHAAVAVTEGLMRVLDREELEGVIAHELPLQQGDHAWRSARRLRSERHRRSEKPPACRPQIAASSARRP